MIAFIDSSSLLKKYVDEPGSDAFLEFLNDVTAIIVAPVCLLEIQSALDRRLRERTLTKTQRDHICRELNTDFDYFQKIKWNENLQDKGVEVIRAYHLKTLDGIQLAAGCLANPDVFMTSDKKLHSCAKKELKDARLI